MGEAGDGIRPPAAFFKRAASPAFPFQHFQQTGGCSIGGEFLDIFTQHPLNKMTMLLDMSYNQAYE